MSSHQLPLCLCCELLCLVVNLVNLVLKEGGSGSNSKDDSLFFFHTEDGSLVATMKTSQVLHTSTTIPERGSMETSRHVKNVKGREG